MTSGPGIVDLKSGALNSESTTSFGPTSPHLRVSAPRFETDERIALRKKRIKSRNSVEQTLQYRTQLSSGQEELLRICYNPTNSHLLTADCKALRLWSLRKELRSYMFPQPVRIIDVHYIQSIDRYACLYVDLVTPSPAGTSKSKSQKETQEHEHATLHLFFPSLMSDSIAKLSNEDILDGDEKPSRSGDILASIILQDSLKLITGGRSGHVTLWSLPGADPNEYVQKHAEVILDDAIHFLSIDNHELLIVAAGGQMVSCVQYTPSNGDTASVPCLIKTHGYVRNETKISALHFLEGTKRVLIGYVDGTIVDWNFGDTPAVAEEKAGVHTQKITSLVNLPRHGDYFSCSTDANISHWSVGPHVKLGEFAITIPRQFEHVYERKPILPLPRQLLLGAVQTSSSSKLLLFVVAGNAILIIEVVAPQLVLAQFPKQSVLSVSAAHSIHSRSNDSLAQVTANESELLILTDSNTIVILSMADGQPNSYVPVKEILTKRFSILGSTPSSSRSDSSLSRRKRSKKKQNNTSERRPRMHHSDVNNTVIVTTAKWDPVLTATLCGCNNGCLCLISGKHMPVFFIPPPGVDASVSTICKVTTLRQEPNALTHKAVPPMTFLIAGSTEGTLICWKYHRKQFENSKLLTKKSSIGHSRGKLVTSIRAHTNCVVGTAGFHHKGTTYVVSGAADGVIKLWEVTKLKMASFFCVFDNDGVSVTRKPELTTILPLVHLQSEDVNPSDNANNASSRVSSASSSSSSSSTSSASLPRLVCGMANGAISVWPLPQPGYPPASGPDVVHLHHHQRVTGLALSPASVSHDLFFLSCSLDQLVILWSCRALHPLKVFTLSSPLTGVTFSFDGSIVAHGGSSIFSIRGPKSRAPTLESTKINWPARQKNMKTKIPKKRNALTVSTKVPTLPALATSKDNKNRDA
jgi:hypothetical protein